MSATKAAPGVRAWTDNDIQWLTEAAIVSKEWMAHPPPELPVGTPGAEVGPELLALCWEAARRDLIHKATARRRQTLLNLSRQLCLAKINLDVQAGGPGAPQGAVGAEALVSARALLPGLIAERGADSIVVARAEAVMRIAAKQLHCEAAR
jgi:hypothetical protein